jgi:hypothetical protein
LFRRLAIPYDCFRTVPKLRVFRNQLVKFTHRLDGATINLSLR